MKRRLFAIMLALVTLCPFVLTGCGGGATSADTGDDALKDETIRETVSITMWVVTDEKTTEEAQAAVEEAFNEITKASFSTYVDLVFCTADEYRTKLDAKFAEIDERIANGGSKRPETTVTGEQYEVNELGVTVLKYPEIYENQIDIVYITGIDQLNDLVQADRLVSLNEAISDTGSAKILRDVIPDEFFKYTKVKDKFGNEKNFAIPNNRVVGDYTYLLVHKDFVTGDANGDGTITGNEIKPTYVNFDNITSINDCKGVIEYIKANKTDFVPILERFDNPYIQYWSEDGSFSLLASRVDPSREYKGNAWDNKLVIGNVFNLYSSVGENATYFTDFELLMKKYEVGNYFATDVEATKKAQNFGVGVIKGDSSVIDQYKENYYIKVMKNPEINDSNIFTSFYGVTNYSINSGRALEVITMLNTNSELRNVLQYGVEGVHYELDEKGRVERFNNDYIMDINTTGNVFIAYPEEDMPDDAWDRGVAVNLDLKVGVTTGFWSVRSTIDPTIVKNLAEQSKIYKEKMDACKTVEELAAFFETSKAEIFKNDAYLAAVDTKNPASYTSAYSSWYDPLWPAPKET